MDTCKNNRNKDLSQLEEILLYKFRKVELLEAALTHRSYFNENKCENVVSYEYLKFLGDSILDFLIRDYVCRICQYVRHLYQNYESKCEKKFIDSLDKIKRKILSNSFLAERAEKCFVFVDENGVCHSLGYFLKLGVGEKKRYGDDERISPYILSDVVKALIGAIYLDADFPDGLLAAKNFVLNILKLKDSIDCLAEEKSGIPDVNACCCVELPNSGKTEDVKSTRLANNSEVAIDEYKSRKFDDPKSLLQKIIHVCYGKEPRYKQIPIEQRVKVSLSWDDGETIIGEGRTKREAEIDAANKALERKELRDLLKEKNSKKSLELLRVLVEICVDDSENSSVDDDTGRNFIHSLLENLGVETVAACLPF